jgi:hypothetical protein
VLAKQSDQRGENVSNDYFRVIIHQPIEDDRSS